VADPVGGSLKQLPPEMAAAPLEWRTFSTNAPFVLTIEVETEIKIL